MNLAASEVLRLGVSAHIAGNLQEAEKYYRAILQSRVSTPATRQYLSVCAQACNNLGFILQHRGDLNTAIDSYRQAVRFKPDYPEAHYNLGFTLQLTGALKAAIENYKRAIAVKPDYAEAHYYLGHALQEKGDLTDSVAAYRQVVSLRSDSADAYNALGTALQFKGDLRAAIELYQQALKIDPGYVEALNNMGSAYHALGELDAAIASCQRALRIKPDYASAYNNLGHAQSDRGDLQAAIASYQSALNLVPDSPQAYNNLGNALRKAEQYEDALEYFAKLDGPEFARAFAVNPSRPQFWLNAKAQVLECLYVLGRYRELEERLTALGKAGDINRRVAAVSAFVSHQLGFEDPHSFCAQPLDVLHTGNLVNHTGDVSGFATALMAEGANENLVWEPMHGVTKGGFQTSNTIFQAGKYCARLEDILRKEIVTYYSRINAVDCEFVRQWPREYDLKGWFVRLVKHGHQRSHIHPAGWLSGVVYLQTVSAADNDEGAIELGLHGYDLPILKEDYPRKIHRPMQGEILLFPSSLFHRTIPFHSDTQRCVIAFDLHPA